MLIKSARCVRSVGSRGSIFAGALLAASLTLGAVAAQAGESLTIEVDRAQIVRLNEPAGSIIIGNPLIADAAIYDNKMLVVTGKSFGSTNLIILDKDGKEVLTQTLEVRPAEQAVLTMQKGPARQSYSCMPNCVPTIQSGDAPDYFSAVQSQFIAASGAAADQAKTR